MTGPNGTFQARTAELISTADELDRAAFVTGIDSVLEMYPELRDEDGNYQLSLKTEQSDFAHWTHGHLYHTPAGRDAMNRPTPAVTEALFSNQAVSQLVAITADGSSSRVRFANMVLGEPLPMNILRGRADVGPQPVAEIAELQSLQELIQRNLYDDFDQRLMQLQPLSRHGRVVQWFQRKLPSAERAPQDDLAVSELMGQFAARTPQQQARDLWLLALQTVTTQKQRPKFLDDYRRKFYISQEALWVDPVTDTFLADTAGREEHQLLPVRLLHEYSAHTSAQLKLGNQFDRPAQKGKRLPSYQLPINLTLAQKPAAVRRQALRALLLLNRYTA